MTTSTTYRIRKLTGSVGVEIEGVDLNNLEDDTFSIIKEALLDQGVDGYPEILLLRNYGKQRTITEVWHSDVTCEQRPPAISILNARLLPEFGGDTMWANQYMAYERLSPGKKSMLEGMRAVHSAFDPEAIHPVVRTHPETGRKALFVNAGFTRRFENMTMQESWPLLQFLVEHATSADLCYRHRWELGDVAMWDNRAVMHFAVHDYGEAERVMHRVTVQGDEPH